MKNQLITTIVIAVLVGALSFFGGMKYQQSKALALRNGPNGTRQFPGRNGNGNGPSARAVTGDILSVDDKSITVKLQDGSSKIVLLSGSTSISQAMAGSKDDLKVGVRVAAFGTDNPDGSVTATNIQLNPTRIP